MNGNGHKAGIYIALGAALAIIVLLAIVYLAGR